MAPRPKLPRSPSSGSFRSSATMRRPLHLWRNSRRLPNLSRTQRERERERDSFAARSSHTATSQLTHLAAEKVSTRVQSARVSRQIWSHIRRDGAGETHGGAAFCHASERAAVQFSSRTARRGSQWRSRSAEAVWVP
eukprot:scaffold895_cov315-Pinguiococcus_pyrenoidosus.AAC.27